MGLEDEIRAQRKARELSRRAEAEWTRRGASSGFRGYPLTRPSGDWQVLVAETVRVMGKRHLRQGWRYTGPDGIEYIKHSWPTGAERMRMTLAGFGRIEYHFYVGYSVKDGPSADLIITKDELMYSMGYSVEEARKAIVGKLA